MAEPEAGAVPVAVQLLPAKPNKMFTEEMTRMVVFLRYTQAVPCAECGKRAKTHWTMLLSFQAQSMQPGAFTLAVSAKVHLPLVPVCRSHLLLPVPLHLPTKESRRGRV